MNIFKNLSIFIILAIFPVFLFAQMPLVCSTDVTSPEKVLNFLAEVAQLEISKYNCTMVYDRDYSGLGFPFDETVTYNLSSSQSKIDVLCNFKNHTLLNIDLGLREGAPFFIQHSPSANIDLAKALLQRYYVYSRANYLQATIDALNTVTELKSTSIIVGNVSLKVEAKEGTLQSIEAVYTVNSIEVQCNNLLIRFQNGNLASLWDSWNQYEVGNTDVRILKEKALWIAEEAAQKSTFILGLSNTVAQNPNFTFVDKYSSASLSMALREGKLYPLWNVQLALDKVFLGYSGFQVLVWADTGEVKGLTSTGMLGIPTGDTNVTIPAESVSSTPTLSSLSTPTVELSQSPIISPTLSSSQEPSALPSSTLQPSQLPSTQTTENRTSDNRALQFASVISIVAVAVVVAAFLLKRKAK
jgi:hypothetical protein